LLGILINYFVILPPCFPDCAQASSPVHMVIGLFEMSKFCAESITGDQREMHAG